MPHQECERVPAGGATEAMEDAELRIDVEGRRLLVMERTQALEGAAGLLQCDVAADEIDEIDAVADRFDRLLGDPSHAASVECFTP